VEAANRLPYFTDLWRNHVLHVSVKYDEDQTRELLDHVQDFMQHLSTRLTEDV
jgi:hypothetical protein